MLDFIVGVVSMIIALLLAHRDSNFFWYCVNVAVIFFIIGIVYFSLKAVY